MKNAIDKFKEREYAKSIERPEQGRRKRMRRGFIMELWKQALAIFAGMSRTRLCDREHLSLGGRMVINRK